MIINKYLKTNIKTTYIALAIFTLLLNIIFIITTYNYTAFKIPIVDAASYHNQAMMIAHGIPPAVRPFWQPPLYIYFLAFIYKHFTTDIILIRIIQSLFSTLTVLFTFAISRKIFSGKPSIIPAILVAIYGPLLFYSSQLLPTTMAVTGNIATLFLWIKLHERPSLKTGLLTGLTIGITALLVSNILIFIPVIIIELFLSKHAGTNKKILLKSAGTIILGAAIVILPVTIRNYSISGQPVLISTNAGINLFIGNNKNYRKTINIRPGYDWNKLVATPYRNGAKNDIEAAQYFKHKVMLYIKEQPLSFLHNLLNKTIQFFNSREIPRNIDLYTFSDYSKLLKYTTWHIGSFYFPFGLIAPFALWGIIISLKNHRYKIIALYTVLYSISIIIFFPASRYIMPIIPAFIILAAMGFSSLLPKNNKIKITGILFCILFFILLNLPIHLPTDNINYRAELHTNLGVGLQTRNMLPQAINEYKIAIETAPNYAEAYYYLGTAYRAQKKQQLAIKNFEVALKIRPDYAPALQDIAIERFKQGHIVISIKLLKEALKYDPDNKHIMINLAIGLLKQKKIKEAEYWLKKAGVMNENGIDLQKLNAFR